MTNDDDGSCVSLLLKECESSVQTESPAGHAHACHNRARHSPARKRNRKGKRAIRAAGAGTIAALWRMQIERAAIHRRLARYRTKRAKAGELLRRSPRVTRKCVR